MIRFVFLAFTAKSFFETGVAKFGPAAWALFETNAASHVTAGNARRDTLRAETSAAVITTVHASVADCLITGLAVRSIILVSSITAVIAL